MFDTDQSSRQSTRRTLARAAYAIAALALVTAAALVWHHYGMQRTVELVGGRFAVKAEDDQPGGERLAVAPGQRGAPPELHCRVVKAGSGAGKACRINIDLLDAAGGMDLSVFDELDLDIVHRGPGTAVVVPTIVNIEEGYTRPDKWETYKINQVDAVDVPQDGHLRVPFKWFNVAFWWKDLVKPPLEHSYVRMDDVSRIELNVGAWTAEGEHVFLIRSVRLRGKLVSESRLLLGLIGLWSGSALLALAVTALTLRRKLDRSDAERAKLAGINTALKLEAQELAGQAHHDPLTGVLNRQGLRAELMKTSTLLTDPLSIVFIDIDHFKSVNDNHGHDVGDEVLRTFAAVLASGIRQSDRLVRWGGEEFLILCARTDVHQAAAMAEKLRQQMHAAAWPAGLHVTASFGVAQHHKEAEMSVAIKRADEELYKAKAGGRDQVRAYLLPE